MLIPVNKPPGITSHDVVNEIRGLTGVKRVGHAGTLDPFATGVLVVGIGRENTKELGRIAESDKEYVAILKFGEESSTGDPEGKIARISDRKITREDLERVIPEFTGAIQQTPPAYSAVRIRGVRAYLLARKGKPVTPPPRHVTVSSIEILSFEYPKAKLKIACSSGTYIRSLAEDIGRALGVGAYLTALERTRVGPFTIQDAVEPSDIKTRIL
ncbi:MAG: tRNA pseudouridine(55) synthase TruB [bacterium]|nr:tRNA pseudouridine(55) synthase TruB [bacterium]MDZ4232111.1 tRNA pseudouridine(55) synthase TruB [Candidatus Pacearchaeota archaeon]